MADIDEGCRQFGRFKAQAAALTTLLAGLGGSAALAQDCISPPIGGPAGTEMCDLGTLDGFFSMANDVNAAGTVVVGMSDGGAFRWVDGIGMQNIGEFTVVGNRGMLMLSAPAVDDGGDVVVGFGWVAEFDDDFDFDDFPFDDFDDDDDFDDFPQPVFYELRALRWVQGEGLQDLGALAHGSQSAAIDTNRDGTVVVGGSGTRVFGVGDEVDMVDWRAFRWVEGEDFGGFNPQMQDLGTLDGRDFSLAYGVNGNGNVVVGASGDSRDGGFGVPNVGVPNVRAFRWVEGDDFGGDNPQMQDLGTLSGTGWSFALDVNDFGNVVVGFSGEGEFDDDDAEGYSERAFRWVDGDGMQDLGTLTGTGWSGASAVNADGTVVVGWSETGDGRGVAFRWVENEDFGGANPEMQALGVLTGGEHSFAAGVNADGTVVVGFSETAEGGRAFIWRGVMEDFENLIGSFPVLADDHARAIAERHIALNRLMGQRFQVPSGRIAGQVRAETAQTGRNPDTLGARSTTLGAISLGHGLSEELTLGGALAINRTRLDDNAFSLDTGYGAALWAQYSAGGTAGTGWQFGAALGWDSAEGEIARGRLLSDVVPATGNARITTLAASATLGYGFDTGGWLLTPSATLAHFDTRRAAYDETGASFNASFDEAQARQTVLTLEMTAQTPLGAQGRLTLGGGIEHLLDEQAPRLTGTSDIPGLTTFDIEAMTAQNRTRPFAHLGYQYDLANDASISTDLRVSGAAHGNTPVLGVGLHYRWRF